MADVPWKFHGVEHERGAVRLLFKSTRYDSNPMVVLIAPECVRELSAKLAELTPTLDASD